MIIKLFKTCKISLSLDKLDNKISENDDISDESKYDIIDDKFDDDIISDDDIASDNDITGNDDIIDNNNISDNDNEK